MRGGLTRWPSSTPAPPPALCPGPDLAARFDRDHRHLYVNAAVEAATGIPAAEFIGKTNEDMGMPAELCRVWNEARDAVFESGREHVIEYEYPGPAEGRWYQSRIVPELDEAGRVATVLGITRDITAQKRAEAELRRSRRELSDFLENATVALHWVGSDGTIQWANRVELEMLGYPAEEYVGRDIREFHVDQDVIADILDRLGRGEEIRDREARLRCKDGSVRHVAINSNVLFEDGEFVHTRCFTTDISERKRAEAERERLIGELHRANRTKSEFLATMSHELRTPLNAIIGYADLLLAGVPDQVPDSARKGIERITLSSRHLVQLIDEILTFSRIEAGRERVEPAPVRLGELMDEIAAIMEPLAGARGLDFICDAGDRDLTLRVDPRKVRQILLNLAANAVKFTDQGSVHFRATARGDRIRFEVEDTGVGDVTVDPAPPPTPLWGARGTRQPGLTGPDPSPESEVRPDANDGERPVSHH